MGGGSSKAPMAQKARKVLVWGLSAIAAMLAIMMVSAVLFTFAGRAEDQQGTIAKLISQLLSSKASRVSIGSVDGPLSSNTVIRNVTVADKDGVWLRVDRVKLVWSRLALLRRRLEVDTLDIGKLEILRRPLPSQNAQPAASNEPILPELPLKVIVKAFKLEELALGPTIAGSAARLNAAGDLSLGPPSEGLNVNLKASRLDHEEAAKITLKFVPKGETLTLDAAYSAAPGGLLSHIAGIPGRPKVSLELKGSGPLDNWAAELDFDAGTGIGAKGNAKLVRFGTARRLDMDINSRIEGLLPPIAAGIFAGTTALKGTAQFGDNGTVSVSNLRLSSQLAELIISGKLEKDRTFDASIVARALPNENGETKRGDVRIGKLNFVTRAQGTFDKPVVNGSFEARQLRSVNGDIDSATADFSVKPGAAGKLDVAADAQVQGFRSPQKGLSAAVGATIRAVFRANINDKGAVDITRANITSPVYDVTYAGKIEAGKITGVINGELLNLSAFSDLAGRKLSGKAKISADITGEQAKKVWDIGFRSQATGLSLGDPLLNRLAGGALASKGRIQSSPQRLGVNSLSLIARGFEADASGALGQDSDGKASEGLKFAIKLADANRIDTRLRGAALVTGLVTGSLDNPNGEITIQAKEMSAIGKPIRDLLVRLEGKHLLGAVNANLSMSGLVDGRALKGTGLVIKQEAGGWSVSDLNASLGSAKINGNARIAVPGTVSGTLKVDAPDLSHLSALLLTQMRGTLSADVVLTDANSRQGAKIKANAKGVAYQNVHIGSASVDVSANDLLNSPRIAGNVRARQLRFAGETIGSLDVDAKGTGSETNFTARASGGTLRFNSAGVIGNGKAASVYLRTFTGVRRGVSIALASPATLQITKGGVQIKSLTLVSSGGRINLSGLAGQKLALKIGISNMPLSIAKAVDPKLDFSGRLRADANIAGTPANPRGNYSVSVDGFASPETRKAGVPRLNISLAGQLQGDRATLKGDVRGGRQIALRIDGAVPLNNRGPLGITIKGVADAGLANAALAGSGQRVSGKLNLDLIVRGNAARPLIAGSATLDNGTFRDPLQGVNLTGITGRFSGRGERLTIDTLTARSPNGGTIAVKGSVSANAAAGFPANLSITASKAQLISNEIMTLVAGLNLTVNGALTRGPVVRGTMDVRTLDVTIPERLPASAAPLHNAKHIAPPRQTRVRLAAIDRARQQAARRKRASASGPRIDVRINAPSQIFVRGRGIDAELGGSLTVSGTANAPRANGAFEIRRGRFDLLTQRIEFTRGRLTFNGDIIPDLDFTASSSAGGITAKINITGRADNPQVSFASEPALPPDEVLSQLLFQKAAGGLTPFQAVQLASAVATLTGRGGPGFLDKARRALGVDTLDVGVGKDGPTVGASRYISRNLSVGVKAGTNPSSSAATVKVDITKRIKLLGSVGGDGRSSIGIGTEIEY